MAQRFTSCAFCFCMFACAIPSMFVMAEEPTPAGGFDQQRALEYVKYLSRDELQGRMSCTEGYRAAADWAAGRLRSWGLVPAGTEGTYFQEVPIRDFEVLTGAPALQVGSRDFPLDDADYTLDDLSSVGVKKRAEVVFVGYGISAPQKGLDEYASVDVAGKIVLVLTGTPDDAPEVRSFFRRSEPSEETEKKPAELWKDESSESAKVKVAYEKGAAAILLFNPVEEASTDPRRRYGRRSRAGDLKTERDFLCMTINERVFRAITDQDPQLSSRGLTRKLDAMRREIKEKRAQSYNTGVQVTLKGYDEKIEYSAEKKNNVARNVLAKIEGSDPELKNQFVIVGAHLDHVGMRNDFVYNGADDNASGSAVVLELARALSESKYQPKRSIVFCLWCGEERGLIGSNFFTRTPCGGVTMDATVAYFNLDMVGLGTMLEAPGALNFPAIWDVIRRDQDEALMKKIEPATGGPGGSDHSGFIRLGIEAMALMSHGGNGHPDYHQPEDDSDKIDPEMLGITGRFVIAGIKNLADETQTSLLVPRRQQLYEGLRMRVANYNPKLEGSSWTQVDLKADTNEKLQQVIYDFVRETVQRRAASNASSENTASEDELPARKSMGRGLASLASIGADERLLDLVIDFYGVGRVDVATDDALWFKDQQLTDEGKQLVALLEKRQVLIHLVSPAPEVLKAIGAVASKPFVVSGQYELTDEVIDGLKRLGCPLGVTLDPSNPGQFLDRVEHLKSQLGERQLLFAMLQDAKDLEKVKQDLYIGLLDRGWAHNEIVGGRQHRGLMGGAMINSLLQ